MDNYSAVISGIPGYSYTAKNICGCSTGYGGALVGLLFHLLYDNALPTVVHDVSLQSSFGSLLINLRACATMLLQITTRCSMGCTHCMGDYKPDGIDMSLEDFKAVVDSLKDVFLHEKPVLLITGGEPLDHPQFADMFVYAVSFIENNYPLGKVVVTTNGMRYYDYADLFKHMRALRHSFLIQVTHDDRYYPKSIKKIKSEAFLFEENRIPSLSCMGRAKANGLSPFGRSMPNCANSIILPAQCSSFMEAVSVGAKNGKFCLYMIDPSLGIYLSECHKVKLTTWTPNVEEWTSAAYEAVRNPNKWRCTECTMADGSIGNSWFVQWMNRLL